MVAEGPVKISIVIPCYNHGSYIQEAIRSVEVYPNPTAYEIIIVNDGSTDAQTIIVLKELEAKGYRVINQNNQGLGAARNNGVRQARGKYILPLDSDNKIRPNYLAKGIQILSENKEISVVYSDSEYFGERSGICEVPAFDLKKLLLVNTIDACAVYRKEIWELVGGYDEKMPIMGYEDWDFWLSVAKTGANFYHLPEVAFDYRVREDSMIVNTNQLENQKRLLQYIFHKHYDLYAKEDLSGLLVELTLARNEVEKYKRKISRLQDDRIKLLKNNGVLLKIIAKNLLSPFLKK